MIARSLGPRLRRCARGVSATEFALALPILITIGCYGTEVANLALTHLRVSQYALFLADNASRVDLTTPLTSIQLREADINDIFQGLRLQSAPVKLTTYGRVTLSSLERQSNGTQLIHWQRCLGLNMKTGYGSSYGSEGQTVASMGDSSSPVTAPTTSYGVMFVEINYDYRPLFGTTFMAPQKLHYIASYLVRDARDYTQIYNPSPAQTQANCSSYST